MDEVRTRSNIALRPATVHPDAGGMNVTDRASGESAARGSGVPLHAHVDAVPALIWGRAAGAPVVTCNHAFCRYTGWDDPVVAVERLADVMHPDDRAAADEAAAMGTVSAQAYEFECRLRRHDGAWRWHLCRVQPIPGEDAQSAQWVGVGLELTDRLESRQRLAVERSLAHDGGDDAEGSRIVRPDSGEVRWLQERAHAEEARAEAVRQKDEFVVMLAHELRNPLAPIRTAVDLLASHEGTDDVVAQCRTVIDRQVLQMARMLDDLLDVSRLSRGQFVLVRRAVELAEVVAAAVETSRPLISQHRQTLDVDPVPENCRVDGDPVRLTQVFANLLNNAAKYGTPGGRIAVRADIQGSWVRVEVQDSGPGLAPEVRARLFEPFVRGDDARRHAPDGMGVGLALSRRLVDLHGGTIAVRGEEPGDGTVFVVTLPLLPMAPAASAAVSTATEAAPRLSDMRVLVADDNVDAADMLRLWLTHAGCQVRVAYDGAAALRASSRFRPDVILLDLSMPDTDGYEVCRRIRGKPWGQAMGIVAVSGWGQDAHLRRSAAAGFDHHLLKPLDPDKLLHLVANAPWARRRLRDTPREAATRDDADGDTSVTRVDGAQ